MTTAIIHPLKNLLEQLQELLLELDDLTYARPVAVLSDASIGQHTRHMIEFFIALEQGYGTGIVNYDLRKRDQRMEADRVYALSILEGMAAGLVKADKPLWLVTDLHPGADASHRVATSYARELVHNLEHVVHHMAIIRIGVRAVSGPELPEDFGVALSTLRHRKLTRLLAQS